MRTWFHSPVYSVSPINVLKRAVSPYLDGLAVDLVGPSSIIPKAGDGTSNVDVLRIAKYLAWNAV